MRCRVKKSIFLAVVLALGTSVGASGCGGGSSTAAEVTITKAVLIKKGDAICRHTDTVQRERLASYETLNGGSPGTSTGQTLSPIVLPPIATEIREVAALGSPKEAESQMSAIIRGWKAGLAKFEEKPSLLLASTEGPFVHPNKLAGEFGFKDCAKAL
jgi:hypothetical protein